MPVRRIHLLLLLLLIAGPLAAASGGPDPFGYTWFDDEDGCSTEWLPFVAPAYWPDPTGPAGPVALPFPFPFHGLAATEVWIARTGFVTFSDQGAAADSDTPQTMPDPGDPNHLIAPMWNGTPARRITAEGFPDRFEVNWDWDGLSGVEPVRLTLFPNGDYRVIWGMVRPGMLWPTIGHEDGPGGQGITYMRDGLAMEPGFPDLGPNVSLCVSHPDLLDCSDPLPMGCDESVSGSLPVTLFPAAEVYTCHPDSFRGNERVVRLDLAGPHAVGLALDNQVLDLFHVPGPPECSEGSCLAWGGQGLDLPLLFAGSHYFVVDKIPQGGGDPFELTPTCVAPPPLGCGDLVPGDTTGGAAYLQDHPCAGAVLDGPERAWLLSHTSGGHLSAVLSGAGPDMWVVLYDPAGDCLAAGRGGATLFDAPAGEYVVVVDGENGASGAFDLEARCGRQLGCAGVQEVACSQMVAGDTTGARRGPDRYGCGTGLLDGGHHVYRFLNPEEQLVGIELVSSSPGQRLLLLDGCDEERCLQTSPTGTCGLLRPGEHFLVVDGPLGSEGPYELEITCGAEPVPGRDLHVVSLDLSGLLHSCAGLDLRGFARVALANRGSLPVSGPLEVVLFEDRNGTGDYEDPVADNLLGSAAFTGMLDPGEGAELDVPVTGTLLFRDAPVRVKVDAEGAIPEANRANNVLSGSTASDECPPPDRPLDPVVEWEWNGSTTHPGFRDVMNPPVVGDVNGDTVPDVVFVAQELDCDSGGGMVHVLSGDDGAEIWISDARETRATCMTTPLLVDLSGDPRPEIVVPSRWDRDRLLALNPDGTLLWSSDPAFTTPNPVGGAPSAGDVDGDGSPEIAWGPWVLDADGSLFWTPEPGGTSGAIRNSSVSPQSILLDVDQDGELEVVAGPTVYKWNPGTGAGEILWRAPGLPDGHTAAANFDDDLRPEVVLGSEYRLWLLDGLDGTIQWETEVPFLGGGCGIAPFPGGGVPTVGDYDGDGLAEIGVAGATWMSVFEGDGSLLWSVPVHDCSSGMLGNTLFDLNGDGEAEVLYMDEIALRFLRGATGEEILTVPASSLTLHEHVTVADLDADGHAELLMPMNEGQAGPAAHGIRVLGGREDGWVGARAVWNQQAYHVANVRDDLTVPGPPASPCEPPSVLPFNTFRVQQELPPPEAPRADLTLAILELTGSEPVPCSPEVRFRVRVGNAGDLPAGRSFEVSFYDGDPAAGGSLLGTETVPDLSPGAFLDLDVTYPAGGYGLLFPRAVADDRGDGTQDIVECDERNNLCVGTIEIDPGTQPGEPSALDLRPGSPPLRVRKEGGGLQVGWEDLGPGFGYRLYRGGLGAYYSHGAFGLCDLSAPVATPPSEAGSHYFLATGTGCGGALESSYGRDSGGLERPDAARASGAPCP